ncbi:hypothetical protein H105_08212 [Trichophyton soudanense CBS 452.61]|uniref:Uncharacterized protein n=1 Tax=Trichophyton soudanense CBS 452.61 TaxID=1215331 RepID=A0A022XFW3_TRISD|nr:hypothetical protein H105_08212 [Trichophyton soudanense CBS 452.61]EZG01679.1 hypothetical protein H106_08081 [Trichophyton rubrum CBS 735.88]
MSKALKAFGISFVESFQKLYKEHTPGARIFPPKTDKNDKNAQLRVDAGEVINGRKYVYLQVNTQATNEALRKWVKKNGTHARLATASFDVNTKDENKKDVCEEIWSTFHQQAIREPPGCYIAIWAVPR